MKGATYDMLFIVTYFPPDDGYARAERDYRGIMDWALNLAMSVEGRTLSYILPAASDNVGSKRLENGAIFDAEENCVGPFFGGRYNGNDRTS